MSPEHTTVASAVILPDESPPSPGLKRRPSSPSESEQKRRRLSGGSTELGKDEERISIDAQPRERTRRRLGKDEEKKRGQRLFGALLGTLSQNSPTTAQKRRADIERKQQTKLKQQAQEYDARKKEDLEKLLSVRRREQKKFDEQSMRIRHSNLLATARFLRTTTEPQLYYKPWKLIPSEQSRIEAQIEDAEATIEEETRRFEETRLQEQAEEERARPEHDMNEEPRIASDVDKGQDQTLDGTVDNPVQNAEKEPSLPREEKDQETHQAPSPNPETHDPSEVTEPQETNNKHGDTADHDGGEVMVEADEDTVIY